MDNVFNAALLGMLAANAVAVEKGNDCRLRSAEHTANVAEMVLCMAQSIAACEGIDPDDMLRRMGDVPEYESPADGILPVAVYLYLKYGEHLLLYQGALEDMKRVCSVLHGGLAETVQCQLYCGILGKLLAGRRLQEAVEESVYILRRFYWNSRECETAYKVLSCVDAGTDIHLQWFQLDNSGTFCTTLDWAVYLLFHSCSYRQCVMYAVNAPVAKPDLLAAAAGTMAGMMYGFDHIPEEWIAKIADRDRIEQCCNRLERYWESVTEKKGIGYGCAEQRWCE